MFSSTGSFFSPSLFSFLLVLLLSFYQVNSSSTPTKIGQGYRLISIEETPDGGIVGILQVKQNNKIYGPDIPLLQLYVK
jgi:alpha-D-xyloside xylohydrolase